MNIGIVGHEAAKWLLHCDKLHRDPAEYDLEVWTRRSNAKRSIDQVL